MEETSGSVAAGQSVMLTCLHGVNASAEADWCRECQLDRRIWRYFIVKLKASYKFGTDWLNFVEWEPCYKTRFYNRHRVLKWVVGRCAVVQDCVGCDLSDCLPVCILCFSFCSLCFHTSPLRQLPAPLMAALHLVSVILNWVVKVFCEFYGREVRKMPELLLLVLNYLLNVLTHIVTWSALFEFEQLLLTGWLWPISEVCHRGIIFIGVSLANFRSRRVAPLKRQEPGGSAEIHQSGRLIRRKCFCFCSCSCLSVQVNSWGWALVPLSLWKHLSGLSAESHLSQYERRAFPPYRWRGPVN